MVRIVGTGLFALAAYLLVFPATGISAAPWASVTKSATVDVERSADIHLVGRWQHHPRRHMRYSLPPDIFKPRCWINQWGVKHCPYRRRHLRHHERRNCTVDGRGRLLCPY